MDAPEQNLSSLRITRDGPNRKSPTRRRLPRWLWALAALSVAVLAWLLWPKPVLVKVESVQVVGGNSPGSGVLTANGYVVARTKAEVSPKRQGLLSELNVTEGSQVVRGFILGRLENSDYVAELRAAKAQVSEALAQENNTQRELVRQEKLFAYKVAPRSTYEEALTEHQVAQAQMRNAKAMVKVAEANLEATLIRAPFDGTVLEKNAEVGELVGAFNSVGDLKGVVTMADLQTLEVEVDVNEAYIGKVQNNLPARVTLDAYPDVSFAGEARQVVPTADRQKATVLVKVAIKDNDPRILPEMGAKVTFLQKGQEALADAPRRVLVSQKAVVNSQVFVVENNKVRAVPVELGELAGHQVVVREGLSGGEQVVLGPPKKLGDNTKVRVMQQTSERS